MNLYKITLNYCDDTHHSDIFVLAENETGASDLVITKWRKWDYWSDAYVAVITLIAQEDQYGKPNILLRIN